MDPITQVRNKEITLLQAFNRIKAMPDAPSKVEQIRQLSYLVDSGCYQVDASLPKVDTKSLLNVLSIEAVPTGGYTLSRLAEVYSDAVENPISTNGFLKLLVRHGLVDKEYRPTFPVIVFRNTQWIMGEVHAMSLLSNLLVLEHNS